MPRKPKIAVVVPFRERFEAAFWMNTWLPLYEAQVRATLANVIKARIGPLCSTLKGVEEDWTSIPEKLLEGIVELDFCTLMIGRGLISDRPDLARARNGLVAAALDRQPDFLYLLDADSVIRKPRSSVEALRLLFDMVRAGADIVSGTYLSKASRRVCAIRKITEEADEFLSVDEARGSITEVDAVGMGCCLVRKSVFQEVEYPWFMFPQGSTPFSREPSEDIYFCNKAREAGFRVWLHGGVEVDHVGLFKLTLDGELGPPMGD